MKKNLFAISLVISIAVTIFSCQPDPGPQPTTPTSPTTPTTPTVTPSTPTTVAGQQQMILGTWIHRQTQFITVITTNVAKDSLIRYENMFSPSTCFIEFTNTPSTLPGTFVVNGGLNCSSVSTFWTIPSLNRLQYLAVNYVIEHLTSDSLVFYSDFGGTKTKYIFNKTGNQPVLSATEIMIAKNWNVVEYINVFPGGVNMSLSAHNGPGAFTNQWTTSALASSGTGWAVTGFLQWPQYAWQVVQGRFNLGGTHYRIDTLTTSKFVISSYPQAGTSFYHTYRFVH
jgi:hypothetical protein